jgi:DNA-directed RNA polymerase specialized sigma24 family protein
VKQEANGPAVEDPGAAPLLSASANVEDFYRKYFLPLVRRASWRHGLTKEDARDVVQEAFVIALVKLDPKRNPKAWLIQVVDHLSANFQRKVVRRAKLMSTWCAADSARNFMADDDDLSEETMHSGGLNY